MVKRYDYIIAGAGCAGLSLLCRMIVSGAFRDKKILLIDKEISRSNDRTWCFWEKGAGLFDQIVFRKWSRLQFHSEAVSVSMDISPYEYKMIRGIDFYDHCFRIIASEPGVERMYGETTAVREEGSKAVVEVNGEVYEASYVFNSIPGPATQQPGRHYLVQHFKGWRIETAAPAFDAGTAALMDFRTDQQYGPCFIYLLPFNEREAMVECTFFTKDLVPEDVYTRHLREYLARFYARHTYVIHEEEYGVIPMTNHSYPRSQRRVIPIGTAAGWTKPSTGYTFQFIQRYTEQLVKSLMQQKPIRAFRPPARFAFYDSVMLAVLVRNQLQAPEIFAELFKNNHPVSVLRFLENRSSLAEEFRIINSLPKGPFLKAAVGEIGSRMKGLRKPGSEVTPVAGIG